MIRYAEGSIFDSGADLLVCPVNTQPGVMGAGLAREFARRWPTLPNVHRRACTMGRLRHRRCSCVMLGVPPEPPSGQWVAFLATKDDWKTPSHLEFVRLGMESLVMDLTFGEKSIMRISAAIGHPIRSIAIPALGCGLGGLDWGEVKPVIESACELASNVEWIIYQPT